MKTIALLSTPVAAASAAILSSSKIARDGTAQHFKLWDWKHNYLQWDGQDRSTLGWFPNDDSVVELFFENNATTGVVYNANNIIFQLYLDPRTRPRPQIHHLML